MATMDIAEVLKEIMEKQKKNSHTKKWQESYHCKKCKDQGYIYSKNENGYETASKCECLMKKEILDKVSKSGMEDLVRTKKFSNYSTEKEYQKQIKAAAIDYTKRIIAGEKISLAILGQSGVGKTHILSAVTRELINKNIVVKYYIADDIVQTLQACKYDAENYNREFYKIAKAPVLFIDDLFKTSIQNYYNVERIDPNDLREIFKILNYRYNKKLPTLISSEVYFERMAKLDEAVAGRINEMCEEKYLISIKPDANKNYRLKR